MSWRDVQLGDGINVKHGFAFKGEHLLLPVNTW